MPTTALGLEQAWLADQRCTGARVLALLFAVAGSLCMLSGFFPPVPDQHGPVRVGLGLAGLAVAGLLTLFADRQPHWLLGTLSVGFSTALGFTAAIAPSASCVLSVSPAVIAIAMFNGHFASRRSLGLQLTFDVGIYVAGAVFAIHSPPVLGIAPAIIAAIVSGVVLFRLTEKLRRNSSTDPLTGAINRTWLLKVLDAQLSGRGPAELSIVMIDLDHFKSVNDEQGHLAGDALLTEVATAWRLAIGQRGTIGRFGGDEFLVLLPQATAADALDVADTLQSVHPAQWSAGIATARDGDTVSSLLARADIDLLDVKRSRAA